MDKTHWDNRYANADLLFGAEPATPLKAIRPKLPSGGRALCVADGEGRNSVWLAQEGFDVTAFDFSDIAVDKARDMARAAGVTVDYNVANVEDWDWDAKPYDLVAAVFVQFVRAGAQARLFSGLIRAVAPGGTLYLLGYQPEQVGRGTGGPPDVDHMYTEQLLRQAFDTLEIVHISDWEEDLSEGEAYKGPSALIEMLARKPA